MKGIKSQLDLDRLVIEIRGMEYWHPLFKLLKFELSLLGYWRNKERGNPALGFVRSRDRSEK